MFFFSQINIPVSAQVVAKNIPHHNKVVFYSVHRHAVHGQVLGQQSFSVPLDNVLKIKMNN